MTSRLAAPVFHAALALLFIAAPSHAQFARSNNEVPPPAPVPAQPGGGLVAPEGYNANQTEAIQDYENSLGELARTVEDAALRCTTLNLVASSKITARRLDEARQDLADAAKAARSLSPGLVRDLRLMATIDNLVRLASEQVVEAVPNNPPMMDMSGAIRETPFPQRKVWLDHALESWDLAAGLAGDITNDTYRSEKRTLVVEGQAAEALKIGRDSNLAGTNRLDLAGQVPDLLALLDRIYQQATAHASKIERAVWADTAFVDLAVSAARAYQYPRSMAIARMIPRPVARTNAMMRNGEEMARVAANNRDRYAVGLRVAWAQFEDGLRRADAPTPEATSVVDTTFTDFFTRLDQLTQTTASLRGRTGTQRAFIEHDLAVRERVGPETITIESEVLSARSQELADRARDLDDALADFRASFNAKLEDANKLEGRERDERLAQLLPKTDDVAIIRLRDLVKSTSEAVIATTTPVDDAATGAYDAAIQSVAAIPLTDPRALATHRLVESLVSVGRFEDARITTSMFPDVDVQYFVLGDIAESMGRRGYAASARKWIQAADVPEERRPALLRRVSQGVLTTVERLRNQTATVPPPSGGGLP